MFCSADDLNFVKCTIHNKQNADDVDLPRFYAYKVEEYWSNSLLATTFTTSLIGKCNWRVLAGD